MSEVCAIRSAGAVVAALAVFISGCAVVTVPLSSVGAPDPRPHLPKGVLENDDLDLMLIASTSLSNETQGWGESTQIVEGPLFTKAKDLQELGKNVKASRKEYPWLVGFNFYTGFIPLPGGTLWKSLDSLCIATADGRALRLAMSGYEWSSARKELIPPVRRDAMVTALRRVDVVQVTNVETPCGLTGTLRWSAEDRARAIEFLQRMPESPAGWPDTPIDPKTGIEVGKQTPHVQEATYDTVNCVVNGVRKWAQRAECD